MGFARLYEATSWWRRGESNPRPRSFYAERLQVYAEYASFRKGRPRQGIFRAARLKFSHPSQRAILDASLFKYVRSGGPAGENRSFTARLIKQRKRNRNRCQLLWCRFLRGQRRLDLQFRLPHPRRNQCAPNVKHQGLKKIRHSRQKASGNAENNKKSRARNLLTARP